MRVSQLVAAQWSLFPKIKEWQDALPFQLDMKPFIAMGITLGMVVALVPLYFLFREKATFASKST